MIRCLGLLTVEFGVQAAMTSEVALRRGGHDSYRPSTIIESPTHDPTAHASGCRGLFDVQPRRMEPARTVNKLVTYVFHLWTARRVSNFCDLLVSPRTVAAVTVSTGSVGMPFKMHKNKLHRTYVSYVHIPRIVTSRLPLVTRAPILFSPGRSFPP
jgi:hypothetical protein